MENQQSLLGPLIPITSATSSTSRSSTDATTISPSSSTTATSCSPPHLSSCQNNISTSSIKGFVCSNTGIIIRLLAVLLAAVISIWANYEASKSFEISVINNAEESPAGQRFALLYVSNDKAIRLVLDSSALIEKLLYPNANLTKKHINHVTLRLAAHNLNISTVITSTRFYQNSDESLDYLIDLSPSLLEGSNVNLAIELAIRRAVARMWLWDGGSQAPTSFLDGMVEYITDSIAGVKFSCEHGSTRPCERIRWEDASPRLVANVLRSCEGHRKGFIQRLNQALKDTWQDRVIDDVLGMTGKLLCDSSDKASSAAGFLHISSM